jgi:hydrogenase-4 component F
VSVLLLLTVALPLLAMGLTFTRVGREQCRRILVVAAAATVGTSAAALFGDPDAAWTLLDGYFVADPASRLWVVTITVVFLGIALYARHRVDTAPELLEPHLAPFTKLSLAFLAASILAVLSNHLVLTWVFVEATTLSCAPLICHRKEREAVPAAWRYLIFSTVGLGLTLLGFACLGISMETSTSGHASFFFEDFARAAVGADPLWRRVGLALVILGYGTKLGLAPMYAWLPEAYDAAPPSVAALLAAIQTSVVFLALIRVLQVLRALEPDLVAYELVGLGMASMVVSTLNIVTETNYKRLLAWAAINHNGVIAVGLGVGKTAAFGVVLYIFSNALVKAILFLACGNIKARYRTKNVQELRGLVAHMPYSGVLFMLGTFALLGFAPFGSFLGEILIMGGLMEAHHSVVFLSFAILFSVVLVATGRSLFPMIWGESLREVSWRGESPSSMISTLFLVGLLFLTGVSVPSSIDKIFQRVAATIAGE